MATAMKNVDLGYVNECDSRLLENHYFPSKVGGKPAWLSLNPIPTSEALTCPKCGGPQVFIIQVYSPRDQDETFHRTIFLFVCRNPGCCTANDSQNFRVYRSQLPRMNKFYSSEPPPDDPSEQLDRPSASKYQALCAVCGCAGPKVCGRCHRVNYCSKEHQTVHWKKGHKKACSADSTQSTSATDSGEDCGILFPEFELEIEAENYSPEKSEKEEEEVMADYRRYLASKSSANDSSGTHFSKEDLEEMATQESEDDKQFRRFKKRIAHSPDQVLRHCRGGEPLWVSHVHKAEADDIPKCSCGADREFEFQVMPQLLNHLRVDTTEMSLDWGTLCIYTCRDSCAFEKNYSPEFVWKQDFQNTDRGTE